MTANIWRYFTLLVLVVLIGALLVITVRLMVDIQNNNVVKTEGFTELMFPNEEQLPKYFVEKKDLDFTFSIGNHTLKNREYAWKANVYNENNTFVEVIDQGVIEVGINKSVVIPVTFIPNESVNRQKIEIEVYGVPQKIHFWMKKV